MSLAREYFCRKTPDDVVWVKSKIKLNKAQGNYFQKKRKILNQKGCRIHWKKKINYIL